MNKAEKKNDIIGNASVCGVSGKSRVGKILRMAEWQIKDGISN